MGRDLRGTRILSEDCYGSCQTREVSFETESYRQPRHRCYPQGQGSCCPAFDVYQRIGGKSGLYDFTIEWTPETSAASQQAGQAGTETTYLEALKEQLGVKLESTTGPIERLIVDQIEEPSPN